jgi:hypothetical protein
MGMTFKIMEDKMIRGPEREQVKGGCEQQFCEREN